MAELNIKVTKAARTIVVNTDKFNEEVYEHVFLKGLEPLINAKMSKITVKDLEGEALETARQAAFEQAEKNLEALYEGKISRGRATAASGEKVSGPVMTEARRLAKEVIKNEIRAAGMKISHVAASDITKAANELIKTDPSFIEMATANLEARKAKPSGLDISALIHESPKLVERAAKAKADRKATLSATQAGKAAKRKPQTEAAH